MWLGHSAWATGSFLPSLLWVGIVRKKCSILSPKLLIIFCINLVYTIHRGTDAHDRWVMTLCSLPRFAYMTKRLKYCCRWRPCSETSLLSRLRTALNRWSLRLRLSQPWYTNMEKQQLKTLAGLHQSKIPDEKPLGDELGYKLTSRKLVTQTFRQVRHFPHCSARAWHQPEQRVRARRWGRGRDRLAGRSERWRQWAWQMHHGPQRSGTQAGTRRTG